MTPVKTAKHVVTLEESPAFDSLIRAYEKWSGNTITDIQRNKIFEGVVSRALDDELSGLMVKREPDTTLDEVAIDFLCGDNGKNLRPEFY